MHLTLEQNSLSDLVEPILDDIIPDEIIPDEIIPEDNEQKQYWRTAADWDMDNWPDGFGRINKGLYAKDLIFPMYRILVCDDEKEIVSSLTACLTAEGYQVVLTHRRVRQLPRQGRPRLPQQPQ